MLCPIKVNSNTIELNSCYCVLELLCVNSKSDKQADRKRNNHLEERIEKQKEDQTMRATDKSTNSILNHSLKGNQIE